MNAKELMKPRYEVIANYPDCDKHKLYLGAIVTFEYFNKKTNQWYNDDGKTKIYDAYYDIYPHLFRKLNWWEHRTAEEMPKKVMSLQGENRDTYEIEEWDMDILVGWIDKKRRSCCSLLTFKPEYGYVPVD